MEELPEGKYQKLNFRLVESTSEDAEHPIYELLKGNIGFKKGTASNGWISSRFCNYPQEIIVQFVSPVNLRQINILSHEKKISSLIEFWSYYPSQPNEFYPHYKSLSYEKLGYIRMDTNFKTNHKFREFRKVFIDTKCVYLKITLHKNYMNKYNVFNQIGLISVDFFGQPIQMNNELLLRESLKTTEITDDMIDELAREKIRVLKGIQDEAVKAENYDEAKKIKANIDRIRLIGKKIYDLEFQKKIYINNEDFDNAKIMKIEIERFKSNLKNIDKQVAHILPHQNITIDSDRSVIEDKKDINDSINKSVDLGVINKYISTNIAPFQ
jgi:centrosomal protein CEP104